MQCQIRPAIPADAPAISAVIITTLRESNAQDYSPQIIADVEQHFCPASILSLMGKRQMYVAVIGQDVVGTASLDQAVVRSVFIRPDCQRLGIGQRLMARLKDAALAAHLDELHVPSSLTAESFYARLGFCKVRDEFHGEERTVIMHLRLDA